MAAAGMPIEVHQLFALPAMGISPESINFKGLTMQSDKAICVRDESAGQKQVVLVDTLAGRVQKRMPMAAEAAILSPDARIIAVRAGGNMQIFNLELEKKIKSHKMPDDQTPVYWSWLNQSTVAIVTATSVYHWPAEGDAAPAKMFDRNPNLSGCQIIAYDGSADSKWLMVAGIKAGAAGGPAQGCMQLYSVERKVSQPLSAHAGCFTTAKIKGRDDTAILFCFIEMKPDQKPKLHIIEVGKDKSAPGGVFRLAPQDLPVAADAAADFPVAVQASKSDIVYVVTKMGYVYLFDLHTGGVIFRNRFSEAPVFAAVHHSTSGGVMTVSVKAGAVSVIKINEGTVVSYILNTLKNSALAMELSSRLGLAGADDLYSSEFESKLAAGDVVGAAKLAASAPGGALRTPATIERFKALPAAEGGQPPVLRYFATLMEHGKLNKAESIELAKPALQQGRAQLLEKWLKEDKLECSSELGDLVAAVDSNLALQVYMRGGDSHEKVVNGFLNAGEWSKIVPYAKQHGFRPNYLALLQTMVHQNPKPAQEFASQLVKHESGPLVEIPAVIDVFMGFNRLQECTSFLLDVLEEDRKDQGFLQTKLLEMNLLGGAPQVVDAILGSDMFHHFDKQHIAQLCERAQLYQRALELYSELPDIKRVLTYAQTMTPKFLESYFGELSAPNCLECLDEMLSNNLRGNLKVVVSVAQKYSEQLTAEELIKLFEAHNSYEGLFYYLGGIVNTSEDPEVHFKYIVAAANLKQVKEVERVCRDSTVYDAVKVKEFLIDAKLPDPRPLIHVCDRHGYVGELTQYLHANKMSRFIDVYVQKVSPEQTPVVVGKLLDLDADEEYIKTLLNNVGQACPVAELVEEVETRNRLRLLQPWLEQRIAEGNTEAATHNAIGKIYITLNKEPQQFLKNNQFYDSLVVGRFCEKLDPYLAYLAYRRAGGSCDEELIEVTNENGLFKDQARYLVERQNLDLWAIVLSEENAQRRKLIDQVTGTALPESKNPDEVSSTVKAFMAADLPNELIGLLEKLVLQGSDFSDNRNLQNLLILTAIKCAHEADAVEGRTMEYINRLDNFDGPEIAGIALKQEYELFEEAFAIYKKFKMNVDAINVLIDRIEDLDRAAEYAERCDESDVWSRLAEAQLEAAMVKQAINSYIKAQDPANYVAIIHAANGEEKFEDLVRFLEMARTTLKERVVDSEMIFALAMCDRLGDLETFITAPNVGDIQAIGDRCFDKELYEAARILFAQINNNAQLARCLVRLGRHKEAVDAAKKANSLRTWKEVNASCVSAGEFYLAQICGLQIIMSPDHLEELIVHYERFGHQDELIKLLEQGVGLEDAHQGIFTELGVLYSKYRPEKLMEHIKIYWSRVNVSKLLRACEEGRHWAEATFLYTETGDFDMAVRTMMEHSPTAFNMDKFFEVIQKVRNQELYYKAIEFFLEEEPLSLTKLLKVLIPKLDHSRVVHQLRKTEENLPLIMPYLKTVQKHNLAAVNEAINENYITEEDYEGLRASIDEHDNFDQIALAQRIEKHELLELRRIAALVYKRNKRFEQSINLSKSDNMYQDAIETAAESADGKLAEDLLRFFVSDDEVDKECFCACLYTCYDLIRPDVALELAWRHRVMDFAMPYIVQYVREVHDKLAELDARTKPKEEHEHDEATQAAIEAATFGMMDPNTLQIADYAYNGQGMPGYGMAPQGMGMGGMPQQGMPQQGMGMGGMGQSGMY